MRLRTAFILVLTLFLLLTILILPIVNAATPIIDGDFFTGDNITIANVTYIIIGTDTNNDYWNNYSAVIFKNTDTKSLFKVQKGKCANTEYYNYCFNDSYYNWDKKITYQGSILEPTMIIKVYYYNPEVKLDRSTLIQLDYGQVYLVESNFTNSGSKETIVHYSEQLPSQFVVTNCNICTITNNKVDANIRLDDGENKTLTYSIQYFGYNNLSWAANYYYTYDETSKSESTTIKSIVNPSYELTETITRSVSNSLGDISTFTVQIKNMAQYANLKVNLSISNQVVKKYNSLNKRGDAYYYEGMILSGQEKNFSILLDSYLVGEFPIYVDAKMVSHNHVFEYTKNHSFNVSLEPLTPILRVDKDKADPNDTITLVASLNNSDVTAQYLYVYAHLLPQDEHWTFYKINPGKELVLYNKTFPIPEDDDDLYIILSGLYRTTNLQEQTFKLVKIIDVAGREPKILNLTVNDTANDTINQNVEITPQEETTQTTPIVPEQTDTETSITESDTVETIEEKDFLTRIIESIDSFIRGIFGKK